MFVPARDNKLCPLRPERHGGGNYIDGLNHQWGYCDTCRVKWAIIVDPFDPWPGETDENRRLHDKALADYRQVEPLEERGLRFRLAGLALPNRPNRVDRNRSRDRSSE